MAKSSPVSNASYDDDGTLFSDDDASSLYSWSSASSESVPVQSSIDYPLPFLLPRDNGPKQTAYEAWAIRVSTDKKAVIDTTKPSGFADNSNDTASRVMRASPCSFSQTQLMGLHFGGIDTYRAKHKRCWASRILLGKGKTYEDDLDGRIRRLPDPVQAEIHALLRDREWACSRQHRARQWTVVLMREQLIHRFAKSEPTEVKRHKLRFWKNISPKKQAGYIEYFVVIRGMEENPAMDITPATEFRRFNNPWYHSDRAESRELPASRGYKVGPRRTRRRRARSRRRSRDFGHIPQRYPVPPRAPSPPCSYPPPPQVASYQRAGMRPPPPMVPVTLGSIAVDNPMAPKCPMSCLDSRPAGPMPTSGCFIRPHQTPSYQPMFRPMPPPPPPPAQPRTVPLISPNGPPQTTVPHIQSPPDITSPLPCLACRNTPSCRHMIHLASVACYRPVRYSDRGPVHPPCIVCLQNPGQPPRNASVIHLPPMPPMPPMPPRPPMPARQLYEAGGTESAKPAGTATSSPAFSDVKIVPASKPSYASAPQPTIQTAAAPEAANLESPPSFISIR